MNLENINMGTGSNPVYFNASNTAKDFSLNESSNPQGTFLDVISKYEFVEEQHIIEIIELTKMNSAQSNKSFDNNSSNL